MLQSKGVHFMRGAKRIAYLAMASALVAAATLFIHIPVPMLSGYCNLGDGVILCFGALLGPWAAAAGALGSAIGDLILGYAAYAPVTAAIKGTMGWIAGSACVKARTAWQRALWMALAEIVMAGGYFLFETVLYGVATAAGSLAGNAGQAAAGLIVGCVLWPLMGRVRKMIP